MSLQSFTAELKKEARRKVLEAKIKNSVAIIQQNEVKYNQKKAFGDAAFFCLENSMDENDFLDQHWKEQVHECKILKEDATLDVEHIALLQKGLTPAEEFLLPEIICNMNIIQSKPSQIKFSMHHSSMHHFPCILPSTLPPCTESPFVEPLSDAVVEQNLQSLCLFDKGEIRRNLNVVMLDNVLFLSAITCGIWSPHSTLPACPNVKRLAIPTGVKLLQHKFAPHYFKVDDEIFRHIYSYSEAHIKGKITLERYLLDLKNACVGLKRYAHFE